MSITIELAKERLDYIIGISRVDLYKPIHIAEVLYRARTVQDIDPLQWETYRLPSLAWRNATTLRLQGKISTSSARYQHDVWSDTAMPPAYLATLATENNRTSGAVERYIYGRYSERQGTVSEVIAYIGSHDAETFSLEMLLQLFVTTPGIRRSVDKAYEIIVYALFETVVSALGATVRVQVPEENRELLAEFAELARVLLGVSDGQMAWEEAAHIYRVGVTNAADRGLDMWANFGPAIQVKHLTLNPRLAANIVDQVESEHVVIVCRDADSEVIKVLVQQIGWRRRVRGIVKESDLLALYHKCLRGTFRDRLAEPLLTRLREGFAAEFPQSDTLAALLEERGYATLIPEPLWQTASDAATK